MGIPYRAYDADGLVEMASWTSGMPREVATSSGDVLVGPDALAYRVSQLAPSMPADQVAQFRAGFVELWKRVGPISLGSGNFVEYSDLKMPAFAITCDWIFKIATQVRPTAADSDDPIKPGDLVAYPEAYARMKEEPYRFGPPSIRDFDDGEEPQLVLTHRQLALHVEFEPVVAAVFAASMLPRNTIDLQHIPVAGTRPFLSTLLAVLAARCPENMDDETFSQFVSWLVETREPMRDDDGNFLIG
jgi:hypothetical protein